MEKPLITREDALMYRVLEAKELIREQEKLQSKIDSIKLYLMDRIYKKAR